MKNYAKVLMLSTVFAVGLNAQTADQMTKSIMEETYNNSQLERLAYELLDGIGPRLVGSPKMQQSHDWAVNQFKNWGIDARNEQWGEWKVWCIMRRITCGNTVKFMMQVRADYGIPQHTLPKTDC